VIKYLHSSVYLYIFMLQQNQVSNIAFSNLSLQVPYCAPGIQEQGCISFGNKTGTPTYYAKLVLV